MNVCVCACAGGQAFEHRDQKTLAPLESDHRCLPDAWFGVQMLGFMSVPPVL